jgi:lipooligosaccharide transport system permease protein
MHIQAIDARTLTGTVIIDSFSHDGISSRVLTPKLVASTAMRTAMLLLPPRLSNRFAPVWRRNLLVWRKLAIASVLGNIADPLLYMLALGYGLGSLIGEVGGMTYIAFIGTGMVCQSAMFTASFEGMYSAFSRMHVQRTWDGIINAPIALDDVVLAEWIWCASKAVLSTVAILAVIMALGYGHTWLAIWVLPLGFLVGLVFGAFGLVMNALAPGYDFFTYFFTLVLTPMLLFSGVYFPIDQMPAALASVANVLPLKHAIDIARPLMMGRVPSDILVHIAVLAAYAAVAYYVALVLTRKRLLK